MNADTDEAAPQVIVPDWPAPPGVRAYMSCRAGGYSAGGYASLNLGAHVGDDLASVAANRQLFAEHLALPAEPRWLSQVHGTRVLELDAVPPAPGAAPEADGAVTGETGVVCTVLTADCVPVLLTDAAGTRVGAVHAGWRGLVAGVLSAGVRALAVPPHEIVAWLGPSIGPEAFEVGDEVLAAFAERGFDVEHGFARNPRGRWCADLHRLAAESLSAAGVIRIYRSGSCTYNDADRFFSHRREAPCGRMAAVIYIDRAACD